MKKLVAALLCFLIILSLFACDTTDKNKDTENDTANTESLEKDDGTKDTSISDINKQYYKIEEIELTKVRYYIYDSDGNVVLSDETDRPLDISMLGDNIVDICIGMGTGISIHKYYDVQSNRFSEEYTYVAATSGNLVAYIDTSMEEPMFNRVLVVRDIFDKNVLYKSFGLDFSPTVDFPIESAKFTEGEAELDVVYLSERSPISLSITLPVRSSSTGGEHLSENEIAMQMYEEALSGLGSYTTPYSGIPLCECEDLGYAYVDLDGDSVNELIIDCGDTLILRYYGGKIYFYEFIFRSLYHLTTNGSYSWNHNGSDFEYGERQLYFEGATLKTRELWRIVNDGEPDAEYYVEGKPVTQEELQKYIGDNQKTKIEFLPLEVSWEKEITSEEALQIASEYWETEDGFTDYGAGSKWVYHIILLDDRSSVGNGYYHIGLQVDHYGRDGNDLRVLLSSRMEHLFVNAVTGECQEYVPILGNGTPVYGKG